jgi:hypothetical protein
MKISDLLKQQYQEELGLELPGSQTTASELIKNKNYVQPPGRPRPEGSEMDSLTGVAKESWKAAKKAGRSYGQWVESNPYLAGGVAAKTEALDIGSIVLRQRWIQRQKNN